LAAATAGEDPERFGEDGSGGGMDAGWADDETEDAAVIGRPQTSQ